VIAMLRGLFKSARCLGLLLPVFLLLAGSGGARAQTGNTVVVATVDGPIMPPTTDYLERSLRRAEREGAACLLIEMNTPGGTLGATREIAALFLGAKVPVVIFVTPSGARAGSAGAILSLAANVLAMSPGTNIGAAHPVNSAGQNIESDMRDKVVNDTAAFARTLAARRGRSAAWAEDIIRKSVSVTEAEAIKLKVADLVATNRADLLRQLNGRKVQTAGGEKTLATLNARVEEESASLGDALLMFLYNPNIALILFVCAICGITAEINHPGVILPGVVGAICLVLSLFAASALSVTVTGTALLLLAVTLFIIDLYATTHGVLTVGGLIAFIVGGLMLFNPGVTGVSVSTPLVVALAVVTGIFFFVIIGAAIKARKLPPGTGPETLIGTTGEARTALNPEGRVFADGSLWNAINIGDEPINAGDIVKIEGREGLLLKVKRAVPTAAEPIWNREAEV
jgi:membrane-bound serine protease (ClpP class)